MGDTPPQGDPQFGRLFTLRDVRLLMHHAAKLTVEQVDRAFVALGQGGSGVDAAAADMPSTGPEAIATMEELLGDITARGELTFAVDEPLFLLRGCDQAAVPAIGAYAIECERLDAPRDHLTSVISSASAIFDWQSNHRDRVRIPPLPEE